jgi:hypothetical protein
MRETLFSVYGKNVAEFKRKFAHAFAKTKLFKQVEKETAEISRSYHLHNFRKSISKRNENQ